jgi:hypothetical protein
MAAKLLNMGDATRVVDLLRLHWLEDAPIWIAELGVYRGATSNAILRAFPNCHLWMVDAWAVPAADSDYAKSGDGVAKLSADDQVDNEGAAREAVRWAADRVTIRRCTTLEAAADYADQTWDAVFLDAAHDYESVRADLAAWEPIVQNSPAPKRLLVCHDYGHPRNNGRGYGVRQAVDEWCASIGRTPDRFGSMAYLAFPG